MKAVLWVMKAEKWWITEISNPSGLSSAWQVNGRINGKQYRRQYPSYELAIANRQEQENEALTRPSDWLRARPICTRGSRMMPRLPSRC